MFYYVYRITCFHKNSKEKYYYGYRSSSVIPMADTRYWSSSKYVLAAIKRLGKIYFKKKILKIFTNRFSALKFEMRLHEKFDVANNPLFFNKSNQTKWGYNCTGVILKGKTYEQIHGIVKAQQLKSHRALTSKGVNHQGKNNPMFGKKHSYESIEKLKKSKLEKKSGVGYFWITNGMLTKKTKGNIPLGWYKGRTL